MDQIIYFNSYNQGIIELTPSEVSRTMYKEAITPGVYDYIDPETGLSFQLVGTTRAFVADPECPIVSQILAAQWQIIYDASYSGVGKLKFVAQNLDNTVSANWKSINDVLQSYNWTGNLPIKALSQVYMGVFDISTSLYVVGTLFTPSQPYLRLRNTASPAQQTIGSGATTRVVFDALVDTTQPAEADSALMVPLLTAPDAGWVQLKVAGLYLVEACVGLTSSMVASKARKISIRLNGVVIKIENSSISGDEEDDASIVGTVRVRKGDLRDSSYPNTAKLEIFFNNTASAAVNVVAGSSLAVTFLG